MSPRGIVALVAAAGLSIAACGSGGDSSSAPVATVEPATIDGVVAAPTDLEPVMVPTAGGTEFDFNSLRGQDVLLWFWAPW